MQNLLQKGQEWMDWEKIIFQADIKKVFEHFYFQLIASAMERRGVAPELIASFFLRAQ